MKTGQCHHVLLLAAMLASQQVLRHRAEKKHGHLCQLIFTVFAIFPMMNGSKSTVTAAAGLPGPPEKLSTIDSPLKF